MWGQEQEGGSVTSEHSARDTFRYAAFVPQTSLTLL